MISLPLQGMRAFRTIWFGQFVSLVGTGMTQFALALWAWEQTGEATELARVTFFFIMPSIAFSLFAGVIIDRIGRKRSMILSDFGAAIATTIVVALLLTDSLQIWHLYITAAISGIADAIQSPAYTASISVLLTKEQYTRAAGLNSMAEAGSRIVAPITVGAIFAFVGLNGILVIDLVTFGIAVFTLMLVAIPTPKQSALGKSAQGSFWAESMFGLRYVLNKPGLLGLQLVFTVLNLVNSFVLSVNNSLVLARTDSNELILSAVKSIGAIGGIAGGLLLATWGGPKRRIHGVLLGTSVLMASYVITGLGRALHTWAIAVVIASLSLPFINGSNTAIWQSKVPFDIQGRVFATRRLIAWITVPFGLLIGGPLADKVFEPAMQPGGELADTFGWLVGTGAGAGMGLMIVIVSTFGILIGIGGYAIPFLRDVEDRMPDYDETDETDEAEVADASDAIAAATPATTPVQADSA